MTKRLTDKELAELEGYVRGVIFFGPRDPLRHIPTILAEVRELRAENERLRSDLALSDKHRSSAVIEAKFLREARLRLEDKSAWLLWAGDGYGHGSNVGLYASEELAQAAAAKVEAHGPRTAIEELRVRGDSHAGVYE